MTREDVISWLEYLSDDARSKADGLVPTNIEIACGMAIDALKEQEPVEPILQSGGNYVCGNCGMYTVGFAHPLTGESVQTWQFCGSCGKKVRWDG